jgi:septal ring factor EnvC (AmiA/AmiB activator)
MRRIFLLPIVAACLLAAGCQTLAPKLGLATPGYVDAADAAAAQASAAELEKARAELESLKTDLAELKASIAVFSDRSARLDAFFAQVDAYLADSQATKDKLSALEARLDGAPRQSVAELSRILSDYLAANP